MRGGLGPGVDYGCPQSGVARDQGAIRVDVFCWVTRRMTRADVGGVRSGMFLWVWKGKGPRKLVCCRVGRGL